MPVAPLLVPYIWPREPLWSIIGVSSGVKIVALGEYPSLKVLGVGIHVICTACVNSWPVTDHHGRVRHRDSIYSSPIIFCKSNWQKDLKKYNIQYMQKRRVMGKVLGLDLAWIWSHGREVEVNLTLLPFIHKHQSIRRLMVLAQHRISHRRPWFALACLHLDRNSVHCSRHLQPEAGRARARAGVPGIQAKQWFLSWL